MVRLTAHFKQIEQTEKKKKILYTIFNMKISQSTVYRGFFRPMYTAIYIVAIILHCVVMHTQYFFGADILVAPVTQPMDNITQMMEKKIWIPEVSCALAQANT